MKQGHEVIYDVCGKRKVRVIQDTTKVDGLGGEVWSGAFILCNYLVNNKKMVENKRVLELGAGCGLCGLVSSALGASSVVLSDEYTDLLNINVDLNSSKESREQVTVETLIWGYKNQDQEERLGTFDLILGSEITQLGNSLHPLLVETIITYLKPSGKAILSMDICKEECVGTCSNVRCATTHFLTLVRESNQFSSVLVHPAMALMKDKAVMESVGALGKKKYVDEDDYSVVIELDVALSN